MAKELDNTYSSVSEACGEVRIADDVVAHIAAIAATEVDGVAGTAGNMANEIISKMGVKDQIKGVKVNIVEGVVTVSLALIMKYGFNIPVTSKNVQERVKTAIENMTGLNVEKVGIKIIGIDMSNDM